MVTLGVCMSSVTGSQGFVVRPQSHSGIWAVTNCELSCSCEYMHVLACMGVTPVPAFVQGLRLSHEHRIDHLLVLCLVS